MATPKPVLREKNIAQYDALSGSTYYEIEARLVFYAEKSEEIEKVNRAIDQIVIGDEIAVSGNSGGVFKGLKAGLYKVDSQGGAILNNDEIVTELLARVKKVKLPDERLAIAGWLLTAITNGITEITREDDGHEPTGP